MARWPEFKPEPIGLWIAAAWAFVVLPIIIGAWLTAD
jgi:hypothetical protein